MNSSCLPNNISFYRNCHYRFNHFALLITTFYCGLQVSAQSVSTRPDFAPVVTYPSGGNNPSHLVAADYNNDSKPDLAFIDLTGKSPSVSLVRVGFLQNKNNGGFAPAVNYPVGSQEFSSTVLHDLNNDSKTDFAFLANAFTDTATVRVLLSNNSGFAPLAIYSTGGKNAGVLSAADVDGNGKTDLFVINNGNPPSVIGSIGVFLNKGDGSFMAAVTSPYKGQYEGNGPASIVAADFNGDKKLDLAIANVGGTISVLIGKGNGHFEKELTVTIGGKDDLPGTIAAGDFNGDGKIDLAASMVSVQYPPAKNARIYDGDYPTYAGYIGLLLGDGAGGFAPVKIYPTGGTDANPANVFTANFNGDNKSDLVFFNSCCDGNVTALLGSDKGFTPKVVHLGNGAINDLRIEDFNGDSIPDMALLYANGTLSAFDRLVILKGKGDGSFSTDSYSSGGFFTHDLIVLDINNDGKKDLSFANLSYAANPGTVGVLQSIGNGRFDSVVTFYSGGQSPSFIVPGDFNGDHKTDLAFTNLDNGTIGVLLNACDASMQSVNGFTLIDAESNKPFRSIKDGDVIDLSLYPHSPLNIRANTMPGRVGSVVFQLSGPKTFKHTENGSPYALFGDNAGDYFSGALPEGDYVLTATPYSKVDGKGDKGTSLTIHFKVIYPAAVTSFTLVNALTEKDIQEVKEGDLLVLSTLPMTGLNIRANTWPDTVGSIVFKLSGIESHQQTENLLPYALFGGNPYNAWKPRAGIYTLTATSYSAPRQGGTVGKSYSIHFEIAQGEPPFTTESILQKITTADLATGTTRLYAAPNPLKSTAQVQYNLAFDAQVRVEVFDVAGRKVSTIFSGRQKAGSHNCTFNGSKLSSGLYYCRLMAVASAKTVIETIKLEKQ